VSPPLEKLNKDLGYAGTSHQLVRLSHDFANSLEPAVLITQRLSVVDVVRRSNRPLHMRQYTSLIPMGIAVIFFSDYVVFQCFSFLY